MDVKGLTVGLYEVQSDSPLSNRPSQGRTGDN